MGIFDVRQMSKTTIAIGVVIVLLLWLWEMFLNNNYLGVSLAQLAWNIFALCVGAFMYVIVVILLKLLRRLFSVNYERSETEESLLFLGTVIICALLIHRFLPGIYIEIIEIVYTHIGELFYHSSYFARARMLPFRYLGAYARILYIGIWSLLVARLILALSWRENTIIAIIKWILPIIAIFVVMIPLAYLTNEQFSLHRIWVVFFALTISVHIKLVYDMFFFDDSSDSNNADKKKRKLFNNSKESSLVDYMLTAIAVLAIVIVMVVVITTFIIFLIVNWEWIKP